MSDIALAKAFEQVVSARSDVPMIKAFFDRATFTVTYVVHDPRTRRAAIVDSVLNYEPASSRTSFSSADMIIAHVQQNGLTVDWVLETHPHADHLSAAPYLREKLGGRIAIGEHIVTVWETFGDLFNTGTQLLRDGWTSTVYLQMAKRSRSAIWMSLFCTCRATRQRVSLM